MLKSILLFLLSISVMLGCRSNQRPVSASECIDVLAFSGKPIQERRSIASDLARDSDNWLFVWMLLSRDDHIRFHINDAPLHSFVDDIIVADVLSNLSPDVHLEVCYAVIDWLDYSASAAFAENKSLGLVTMRGQGQTKPINEIAHRYLTNRFYVDHGYDKDNWKKYLDKQNR